MKKLLVFIGGSGSGKTTLIAKLVASYPKQFRKIVTCTSRPMRVGEVNGVDYHFLPEKYFIDSSDLVLTKKTYDGLYYATRGVDLFSTTHNLLLTSKPTGISKLVSLGCKNIAVIRISISERLKRERMRRRGDTEEMISNRLQADTDSSTEVDLGKVPIIEIDANQTIEDKIEFVLRAC